MMGPGKRSSRIAASASSSDIHTLWWISRPTSAPRPAPYKWAMIGGSASNTLISDISTVAMIDAAMPTEARSIADSRPAIAVSITAFAIQASCATSTGQARWMSCEVGEAERSIPVF